MSLEYIKLLLEGETIYNSIMYAATAYNKVNEYLQAFSIPEFTNPSGGRISDSSL